MEVDKYVVSKFSDGSKEAFNIIYSYYKDSIFSNIHKIIHQEDIAEDILQDVFIKLWENRQKLKEKDAIVSWLFRVSYNCSISCIRNALKERSSPIDMVWFDSAEVPVSENYYQDSFLKENLLREALALLPIRKRQTIELCKLQGKSYSEAGHILGIATTTVKEYLIEAKKFLRAYVLARYPESTIVLLLCHSIGVAWIW